MRILIVDDDAALAGVIRTHLIKAGHAVVVANGVTQAERRVCDEAFDLVITDIVMPDGAGTGLVAVLRERFGPDFPVVAMSGGAPELTSADGLNLAAAAGAATILYKPFTKDELLRAIDRATVSQTR